MTPIRLMRSFATVGGWTLFSRLLGFVRDVLMARFLGAGTVADAFFVAFSLPNMFRRFFAEGPSTPPSCRCSPSGWSRRSARPRISPATPSG
jgi:hypothetical protein